MKKTYNKLVRDRIPKIIAESGCKPHYRQLSPQEFEQAIMAKMAEEAIELQHAETREEVLEELADIMEVALHVCNEFNITKADIDERRNLKCLEKGSFYYHYFLESVEDKE